MKKSIQIMLATILLSTVNTAWIKTSAEADIFSNPKNSSSDEQPYGLPVSHEELHHWDNRDEYARSHPKTQTIEPMTDTKTGQDVTASTEHIVKIDWNSNDGKTGDSVKRTFYVGKSYVKEIIGQALEGNKHAIAEFESTKFSKRFRENYNTAEKQEVLKALEDKANQNPDDPTIKNNLLMIIKKLNALTLETGQDIYHNDSTNQHHISLYKNGESLNSEISLSEAFKNKIKKTKYEGIINQRYLSLPDAQRKIFVDTLNVKEDSKLPIEHIIDTAYDTAIKAIPTTPTWSERMFSRWKPKPQADPDKITPTVNLNDAKFGLEDADQEKNMYQNYFNTDEQNEDVNNTLGITSAQKPSANIHDHDELYEDDAFSHLSSHTQTKAIDLDDL